jgi:hypothetical protein
MAYQTRFKSVDDIDSEYRIFSQIIGILWTMPGEAALIELAKASNVGKSTLYSWKAGATLTPQIGTLTRVAHSLGFEIVMKRTRRAPLRTVK